MNKDSRLVTGQRKARISVAIKHCTSSNPPSPLREYNRGYCRPSLPLLTHPLQQRFAANELRLQELLADAGYSTGSNYAFLEQRGITPWIPVFGKYKPVIEGFTYEPDVNAYRCPAGKRLPFRNYCTSQDGNWLKNYRAEYRDCQTCPLKPTCVPSATQKKLVRSPYDAAYLRAWQRQQSRAGQRRRRVRQGTVEPVFGNLLHHYGLRRVNTKGQAAAQKAMVLSAVAYNLKKLLKYQSQRVRSVALACQADHQQLLQEAFWMLFGRWLAL